jgi:DNA-binding response OmpR family regulator
MKEAKKQKILILEDEKPLAHALELKLTHEGFEVTTTDNGETGIALIMKEKFDLILTDLILETVKSKKMKVPIIVMTNLNQEEDKKKAYDLGAANFFVKSNSPLSEIVEGVKKEIK